MSIGETLVKLGLALLVLASGCKPATVEPSTSPDPSTASSRAADPLGEQAPLIPGTRVRMHAPAGAQRGDGFLGYAWPDSAASIMVIELPGPYSEVSKGLTAQGLASQGVTLLSHEPIEVGDRAAVLLHATQESQGIRFEKWIFACGDEANTVIINAIYPEALAGDFAEPFRTALLGVHWDPSVIVDPREQLEWTIEPPQGLRLASAPAGGLMFSESGEFTPEDHGAPIYIAVPSMGHVLVEDPQTTAEAGIYEIEQVRESRSSNRSPSRWPRSRAGRSSRAPRISAPEST